MAIRLAVTLSLLGAASGRGGDFGTGQHGDAREGKMATIIKRKQEFVRETEI